eukprot:706560-Pelagomonas_calceolata.AAC.2
MLYRQEQQHNMLEGQKRPTAFKLLKCAQAHDLQVIEVRTGLQSPSHSSALRPTISSTIGALRYTIPSTIGALRPTPLKHLECAQAHNPLAPQVRSGTQSPAPLVRSGPLPSSTSSVLSGNCMGAHAHLELGNGLVHQDMQLVGKRQFPGQARDVRG